MANNIFLYVFFGLCILYFLFFAALIFWIRIQINQIQKIFLGYMFFVSVLLNSCAGIFVYFTCFSHIIVQNPIYSDREFLTGIGLLNFIIAISTLILWLAINALTIVFLNVDNPFFSVVVAGSSKLYFLIYEAEKIIFTIYFIIDLDKSFQ